MLGAVSLSETYNPCFFSDVSEFSWEDILKTNMPDILENANVEINKH